MYFETFRYQNVEVDKILISMYFQLNDVLRFSRTIFTKEESPWKYFPPQICEVVGLNVTL